MRRAAIFGFLLASLSVAQETSPSLIERTEPEYSAEAAQARVQSVVVLSIVVGTDGKARDFKVTQGAGFGLDEKAVEAVREWTFRPATRDGAAIAVPANIEVSFNMLVKDKEDHTGQRARLNFSLPAGASRPVLVAGRLPGNPSAAGDQALTFHLQVDANGVPQKVTATTSTDAMWEKQVESVVRAWRFRPAMVNGAPILADAVFEMEHSGPLGSADAVVVRDITLGDEGRLSRQPASSLPISGLSPRVNHAAVLLPNGTVLLAGGAVHESDAPPGTADFHETDSAQIFDWATRKIVNTGTMVRGRSNFVATSLADGTVLLAGGEISRSGKAVALADAEIYDPSTGRFSASGSMRDSRIGATAARLPDGRVLICGGRGGDNRYLDSAEIYDPKTRTFSPAGKMTAPRAAHRALALKDGRILVIGGFGSADSAAEVYDPAAASFRAVGNMTTRRYGFGTALLGDGQVLVAGGAATSNGGPAMASAELFDPASNTFHATGSMTGPREFLNALTLADGSVLITGGIPGLPGAPLTATEIYDSGTGAFRPGPLLSGLHTGHTATLLQDGNVFVAGSGLIGYGGSAEILLMGSK